MTTDHISYLKSKYENIFKNFFTNELKAYIKKKLTNFEYCLYFKISYKVDNDIKIQKIIEIDIFIY